MENNGMEPDGLRERPELQLIHGRAPRQAGGGGGGGRK